MNIELLEDIGLTHNEIKIYLSLLELGSSSAGNIIEKSRIQNSVFHFCVNRLVEKGFVSYTKKNKFRVYSACDPSLIVSYVEDKARELKKIIPELKARQKFSGKKQEVELFEGISGIITLLNALIENARKGDEFLFFAPELEGNEEIQKFYTRYDLKRKDKGLITKGITSRKLTSLFVKRKYLKMKYTDMPVPANCGICGNKVAMLSWGEKPIGVLIDSKQIADKQRDFFNALWRKI